MWDCKVMCGRGQLAHCVRWNLGHVQVARPLPFTRPSPDHSGCNPARVVPYLRLPQAYRAPVRLAPRAPRKARRTLERRPRPPARRRRPSDAKLRIYRSSSARATAASASALRGRSYARGGTASPELASSPESPSDRSDDSDDVVMLPHQDAAPQDPSAGDDDAEDSIDQDDDMYVVGEKESDEDETVAKKPPLAPLPPASFLAPGQTFSGSQTVNQCPARAADEWRVNVHIQAVDWHKGRISGSMEALDVPKAVAPVVTFWQGEIVDNRNYFFWTGRWDAHVEHDVDHWKRFVGFAHLHSRVKRDRGDDIDLASSRYIFMRWKEIFFVSPGEDCGLTIAGFYYICMDRFTGSMLGYYYDPKSQPYQELRLNAVSLPGGHVFSTYDFN